MNNIDELEALAKAATPGPWYSAHHGVNTHGTGAQHDICRVSMTTGSYESEQENRDYIAAANPAAILTLIAEVRALRETPSDDAVLCALVAWFDVNHPDQEDFRARMRKAIAAARGAK
jgi:hypothetical protein